MQNKYYRFGMVWAAVFLGLSLFVNSKLTSWCLLASLFSVPIVLWGQAVVDFLTMDKYEDEDDHFDGFNDLEDPDEPGCWKIGRAHV